MDDILFSEFFAKLQNATWELDYPANYTKMFTSYINGQKITLYNVMDPIYINNIKLNITNDQALSILDFVNNTLIVNFSGEINDAIERDQNNLNYALDAIVNG